MDDFLCRKANLEKVKLINEFLQEEVDKGVILFRNNSEIAQNIRSYTLIEHNNQIVALGALHIHTHSLGEIRSLAVKKEYRNQGLGKKLILKLLEEGKDIKLKEVLVLTFRTKLFQDLDFKLIEKELIPNQKIWQDCIKCKLFPKCEEQSLIKTI